MLHLKGPAGRLETLLELPETGVPSGAAIVCHPHPLHGGTLRNTLVFRMARALRSAGVATLRFNFRGIGESEGEHCGAGGEIADAAACLDFLEQEFPGQPLWAAGYSFGARTICALALADARVERVVGVALPVAIYDCTFVRDLRSESLFVFGDGDEFGTLAEFEQGCGPLGAHLERFEIEGADHFFRGHTPEVEEGVRRWAEKGRPGQTASEQQVDKP